jgi:DNA polymerase
MDSKQILTWYIDAGVDEAIGDETVNYFDLPEPLAKALPANEQPQSEAVASMLAEMQKQAAPHQHTSPLHHSPSNAALQAREIAQKANSLLELETAVRNFDGCAIKKTASKTVFCDGNVQSQVMIIGEAPGAPEDLQGIPFCGPSGQLLDRMLAAIGLDRTSVYLSNTVFWRPPGNRQPTPEETSICLPFVEKHIALVKPKLLVLSGGIATTTLLKKDLSISRLRGKLYDYQNEFLTQPIPTIVTFHPSYLLRTPTQKRLAWNDLLMINRFLTN